MKLQYWTSEMEKQVGDRIQIVLNDPKLLKVFNKYGADTFRRSSVFHGLGKFLTAQNIKGKCCFEIGSWNGLTAVVLSQFFDKVVSVDIAHNQLKFDILSYLEIKNVEFIHIKDNKQKAKVANELHFDFAYVDGNHAYDTQSDWDLTKKAGRVLFHECWPFQEPVWQLVHTLPHLEVTYGGAGLALWQEHKRAV